MYVEDTYIMYSTGRTKKGGEHYNKFGIYHTWISRWKRSIWRVSKHGNLL